MEKSLDWFFRVIRIAGVAFPVASSLVQLQAEIDSKAVLDRIRKLEDPISFLHEDVPEVSRSIYEAIKCGDKTNLSFDDIFYNRFGRVLAALESQGYIKCIRVFGKRHAAGIEVIDPSFLMYLCALCESDEKMSKLINIIDSCEIGKWLNGKEIKVDIDLPLPVIKACFDIYESKGYGLCSKTCGVVQYMGKI